MNQAIEKNFNMIVFIVLWFLSLGAILLITYELNSTVFEITRLYFAGVVLCVLGHIFVFAIGILAFSDKDELGRLVFDACKTIIPPIVTLVLGYYFGQYQAPNIDQGQKNPSIEHENQATDKTQAQ